MRLIVSLLKLTWLSLQLVDTFKIIKRPAPRKSKIKIVDQEEKDATVLQATPPRTRMSTLKRDKLRKVLQSWIVWMLFSYLEGVADHTIGLIMPFYNHVKIVFLLALSIPRSSTLPYIYDRFLLPRLKRHSRKIDLSFSLFGLVGQYLLQLVLCATIVPVLTSIERVRSYWGQARPDESIRQTKGRIARVGQPSPPPPPGGFEVMLPDTAVTSAQTRKKPRKSVLDNVLEFSLGTPRTLRQTVHQARALYGVPEVTPTTRTEQAGCRWKDQSESSKGNKRQAIPRMKKDEPNEAVNRPTDPTPITTARAVSGGAPLRKKIQTMSRSIQVDSNAAGVHAASVTRQNPPVPPIRAARAATLDPLAMGIPTLPSKSSLKAAGPSRPVDLFVSKNTRVRTGSAPPTRSTAGKTSEEAFWARLGPSLNRSGGPSDPIEIIDELAEEMEGIEHTGSSNQAIRSVSVVGGRNKGNAVDNKTEPTEDIIATGRKTTPRKRKQGDTAVEVRLPKVRRIERPAESMSDTRQAQAAPLRKKMVDSTQSTMTVKVNTVTEPAATTRERKTTLATTAIPAVQPSESRKQAPVPEGRTLRSARRKLPVEGEDVPTSSGPGPRLSRPEARTVTARAPAKRAARNLGHPQRPERR